MASNHAVELIARRLSIRPEQAEEALDRLSAHLLRQVRRDGHVIVGGLGTFRQEGDAVGFEPAEELDALVNADFADLEPVTIYAPRPAPRPVATRHRVRRRGRTRAAWGLAGFAVVLAGALFLMREQSPSPDFRSGLSPAEQAPASDEQLLPENTAGAPEDDGAAFVQADGSAAAANDPSAEGGGDAAFRPGPEPSERLAIDPAQGGYTVIVASFRDLAVAQSEAAGFRALVQDAGVPVDVLRVVVEGTTQYRVSVGQEPTRSEALALRSRLASLPDDAWIRRIGLDN